MTALQTHAKVNPGVSGFDAILADVCIGAGRSDLIEMSA